ncbi:MAG: hypothetical protein JW881_06335 [Spirochaetales bacterium]|nr:hypothetical protein [Spirochaetales bacterium]
MENNRERDLSDGTSRKENQWHREWNHKRGPHKGGGKNDEVAVGIAATLGFGIALFFTKIWWLIFPLVFVGLIPLMTGLRKLMTAKKLSVGTDNKTRLADREKEVLRVASGHGGQVTVLQIAHETTLSIEDARAVLDGMVNKGYVQLLVDDNGLLRYEFPDFLNSKKKDEITEQIDKLKRDT